MKVVTLFSGGLDSTALLWWLKERYDISEIQPISINYGQRHKIELENAKVIACLAGADLKVIDVSGLAEHISSSALTGNAEVPHGHYEDEMMKQTVVPNRNMIFLSIAAGVAIELGAGKIAYAAHAGDHAIYPDCRPEFAKRMNEALSWCSDEPIVLETPFVDMKKDEILIDVEEYNVPFGSTYSCYEGGKMHCGKCGTCVERKEAFELAGIDDPTKYEECN